MSLAKWHNHWPGGIPSFLRRHDKPVHISDQTAGDVDEASRAWRFFVREQWVDVKGVAADEQRRTLIERWATADQAFRDVSYKVIFNSSMNYHFYLLTLG